MGRKRRGKQVLIPEAPVHAVVSSTLNIILFSCQFHENSGAIMIMYKGNGYCSLPRISIISKWLCVYVFMQVLVGHSDHVTCVAVSILNKSLVVSGSRDANLIVWDINTGNDIHILTGHLGYVTCVKVTGDGSLAVSGILVIIEYNFVSVKGLLQYKVHNFS